MKLRTRLGVAAGLVLVVLVAAGVLLPRTVRAAQIEQVDSQLRSGLPGTMGLFGPDRRARSPDDSFPVEPGGPTTTTEDGTASRSSTTTPGEEVPPVLATPDRESVGLGAGEVDDPSESADETTGDATDGSDAEGGDDWTDSGEQPSLFSTALSDIYVAQIVDDERWVRLSSPVAEGRQPELPSVASDLGDPVIVTVGSVDGEGQWRAMLLTMPSGDQALVAVPLDRVDATAKRLTAAIGVAAAAVLLALLAAGWWLLRLGLRPIAEVTEVADAIAQGDRSRRVGGRARSDRGGKRGRRRRNRGRRGDSAGASKGAGEGDGNADGNGAGSGGGYRSRTEGERHLIWWRRRHGGTGGTEADQLARAFNVMLDEQAATEMQLRQFVADASHELRTPVAAIRGFADLWRSGALDPDQLDDVMRRIGQESTRMRGLVEDLLLLARLDQGRVLAVEPVDLAALAADAALDASATHPSRTVRVETPRPAVVTGDEARLRQVVANLVSNALVHTTATTTVVIRAERCDHDGGTARLAVGDDGPGMSPEAAARAFDRFWRGDPGRARGGAGLGLSIVRSIVAAHHGDVALTSTPGVGTTVEVLLPAAPQPTLPPHIAALPAVDGDNRLAVSADHL